MGKSSLMFLTPQLRRQEADTNGIVPKVTRGRVRCVGVESHCPTLPDLGALSALVQQEMAV